MKRDESELSDSLRNPFLPRGALIRRAPYSSLRLHKDKSGAGASAEKVKEGKGTTVQPTHGRTRVSLRWNVSELAWRGKLQPADGNADQQIINHLPQAAWKSFRRCWLRCKGTLQLAKTLARLLFGFFFPLPSLFTSEKQT